MACARHWVIEKLTKNHDLSSFGCEKSSGCGSSLWHRCGDGGLAQETRLNIFRLVVRHAPNGLPAGTIAHRLRLPGPTLSLHLNVLAATGLVRPDENGR